MDEFELIKKYFQKISYNNTSAKKLNDDIFFDKKRKLAVSVDTYNEGVHFPNFKHPNLVIKKVIRSSISDLIAKGVKPEYYFISGSGNKKQFTKKNLKIISKSLNQEQTKYNLKLSGGDTTNSNKVSFSITSIGFSKNIVERNKARLNDDIYVTGNIGDSFLGLKIIELIELHYLPLSRGIKQCLDPLIRDNNSIPFEILLRLVVRYFKVATEAVQVRLEPSKNSIKVIFEPSAPESISIHQMDGVMLGVQRILQTYNPLLPIRLGLFLRAEVAAGEFSDVAENYKHFFKISPEKSADYTIFTENLDKNAINPCSLFVLVLLLTKTNREQT